MSNVLQLDQIFQRSRERVKGLGEVFTPETYVEEMLDILGKDKRGFWSDETIGFFEPSCGHGNIVLPIYRRRLEAIYKKAIGATYKEACLYAVANALNGLWAVDIDKKNIQQCRSRILAATVEFIQAKLEYSSTRTMLKKHTAFIAHVLCAIAWQIQENETLSSLSSSESAKRSAGITRSGQNWFNKNGHKQIDFELTWVKRFECLESKGTVSIEYEKAMRLLKNLNEGTVRSAPEFDFIESLVPDSDNQSKKSPRSRDTVVGL